MTRRADSQYEFYLATEAATAIAVDALDLTIFNRVYLGNPYCLNYAQNLLTERHDLSQTIGRLNAAGTQTIISLPAMPCNDELPIVSALIDFGISKGATGFEVHSAGVLHMLSQCKEAKDLHVVAGGFSNVYTQRTAALYADKCATLIVPNYELPWDAIKNIAKHCDTPLELLVHGKIPLGLSESCLLVERAAELSTNCPESCLADLSLEFHIWQLRSFGKLTASGRDLCLLPEMPCFWQHGVKDFRIAGLTERPETINAIGSFYRRKIGSLARGDRTSLEEDALASLRGLTRYGLCNGYMYGTSGCDWIEQHLQSA